MSMLTCWKRLSGTSKSPIGGMTCLVTFACWQGRHSLAQRVTSCLIDGQTTFSAIIFLVRSTPGCPRPWKHSNTFRREAYGMYGLAGPFEKSTTRDLLPMSMDLRLSPVLASFLSALNSGSRACWVTISSQLRPRSPTAAMTQLRSLRADSFFSAAAAADAARFAVDSIRLDSTQLDST